MESDPPATMTRHQPRTRWGTAVTLFFSIALSVIFSGQQYSLLAGADAQSSPNMGPLSVSGAATARTATKMYVQGGNHSGTEIRQLFSLDLAVPWSTNMPAWRKLTNTGPAQQLFPAAFSADEQTMITFHSGVTFAYRYSVPLDRWSPSTIAVPNPGLQGVEAVLNPEDGQIYLTGGYKSRNQMSTYNFVTDTITNGALLPSAAVALEARAYYGSVWSKSRKSILYFGGYNETLLPTVSSNVVTEYVPSTGQWQTLNIVGVPPPMRSDHCMVISDDGTQIVIYGGTLSTTFTYTNDIYILDLMSLTWRQGVSGLVRAYSSCVLAGSQFLVWGGVDENKNMVSTTILIYDINLNTWINNYAPPPSYIEIARNQSSTNSSNPGSGDSSGSTSTASSSSSHVGAIAGGVVCGIAVVCAVVLFLIFRKRFGAHGRTSKGLASEGRDRKYPANLSQNDEELQNLRLQVQTQEEELELRRRIYQLQQEQQQHQQLQFQMQPQNPYATQPTTIAAAATSSGGGITTYGYDPFRNVPGATPQPHPYAQQQRQQEQVYQQQLGPIKSPGPIGPSGFASPLLPSYSIQAPPYQRDQQQGGMISQAHSLSTSSSSAVPLQSSTQSVYAAHPYRPIDGSPTPSHSLVSATNTIGSMSVSSQPPSRVNSARHQQQRSSNTQRQGDGQMTADAPSGSTIQQGIGAGSEVARGRSLQNPQLGARERAQ